MYWKPIVSRTDALLCCALMISKTESGVWEWLYARYIRIGTIDKVSRVNVFWCLIAVIGHATDATIIMLRAALLAVRMADNSPMEKANDLTTVCFRLFGRVSAYIVLNAQ